MCQVEEKTEQPQSQVGKNSSRPLDFDILAVHACEQGLLNNTHMRKDVVKAIQHYHEEVEGLSEKNLPHSTVSDKIYQVSLNIEMGCVDFIIIAVCNGKHKFQG